MYGWCKKVAKKVRGETAVSHRYINKDERKYIPVY